jgi:hypothetical protein
MFIIGCDFHSRFQQIAMLDPTTGEVIERRLEHENGEAKKFYATLPSPARVGMEATMNAQWFERVLQEHHHELWIGDAAKIRAAMVRKQKTDSRDAWHILDLLLTNRFPRIWVPSPAERDLRQMLRHRHKLVGFRTSVKNQLHALAMGQGLCRRKKLWGRVGRQELESLVLDPELRRDYQRLKFRRGHSGLAKVAMARKLAVRLYWKLREAARPAPPARMQGSPASPVVGESLSTFRKPIDFLIERPASPGRRKGSSEEESWSAVEIEYMVGGVRSIHRRILRSEPWSRTAKESWVRRSSCFVRSQF